MEQYRISLEHEVEPSDRRYIIDKLVTYNTTKVNAPENSTSLAIFIRNGQNLILGGLLGYTQWNWLFISHLWVADELRGKGKARELMAAAEKEAISRGCCHAHLDTFSFQALSFYEKLGYRIFGKLDDYPAGHTRYFLHKRNLI